MTYYGRLISIYTVLRRRILNLTITREHVICTKVIDRGCNEKLSIDITYLYNST